MIAHLSPLLKAQAAYRLGPARGRVDLEDVVADAWLVALRRLPDLLDDRGRHTPRLVSFLATTIVHIVNRRLEQLIRRNEVPLEEGGGSSAARSDHIHWQAAEITDAVTQAVRGEIGAGLEAAFGRLAEKDREVVILRGIEGLTNEEAANRLQEAPNTVSHRYRRALEKLRLVLPASLFENLADS